MASQDPLGVSVSILHQFSISPEMYHVGYRKLFFRTGQIPSEMGSDLIKSCLQVYDVTPFMDDHPRGDEVLLAATGKDAIDDFEDTSHSDNAREMMVKYYIGDIDSSTVPQKCAYVA